MGVKKINFKKINISSDDYFLNPYFYNHSDPKYKINNINKNNNTNHKDNLDNINSDNANSDDDYDNFNILNKTKNGNNNSSKNLSELISDLTNHAINKKKLKSTLKSTLKSEPKSIEESNVHTQTQTQPLPNNLNNSDNTNEPGISNKNFHPIIYKYIANNNFSQLETLLKTNKSININQQDKDGDTPLHIAVFMSNSPIVKLLLDYGADPFVVDKWGQTPLHRICFSTDEEKIIQVLELFIKKNIEDDSDIFNLQDKNGNTVCHLVLKHIIKNKSVINKIQKKLIGILKSYTNKLTKNFDNQTIMDLMDLIR